MRGYIPARFCAVVILLLLGATALAQAPATRAATRPATRSATSAPATRAAADRQKVQQLTRRSLQLLEQKKVEQAGAVLEEALALDPEHSTNLYNMACVKALTGRTDDALAYLERAAEAGFTDFVHIGRDTDLVSLRELPRYKALVARKDEFQKRAAQTVIAALKEQFGEGYLYEIDERDKLIFATNTDPQTLAALKKNLQSQARSQWAQIFEHKPDQYISVVLPSLADYRRIVSRPGVGGFYNSANRILISQRLGQVMTHEFTHALHDADVESLGQEHPIWVMEGMAVLWEAATFDGETLIPREGIRLAEIQQLARAKRLIPLDRLLKMSQDEFIRRATAAYGQSGSLMLYLYEQKLLRKFYDSYKAGFEKDATGKEALEATTGMKLADLDKAWQEWMLKRSAPPAPKGPDSVFIGVRFGQANDGVRIDEVLANSPAAAAGIAVGDCLVGIDGVDVRDYQSLLPILGAHRPGQKVSLRLRRGEEYKDVPLVLVKRSEVPASSSPASQPVTRPTTRGAG